MSEIVPVSAVTYQWVIVQLDCKPSVDGLQDYVVVCHYRYNGVYQDIFKEVYGTCSFEIDPEKPNYIPYADLTESDIIGWLEASLDVNAMQISIDNQINDALNPPIIVLPLPWANTEA
jgi:hypothetical protein